MEWNGDQTTKPLHARCTVREDPAVFKSVRKGINISGEETTESDTPTAILYICNDSRTYLLCRERILKRHKGAIGSRLLIATLRMKT